MTQTKKIYWADKLGVFSSLLCIVHCLAVPTFLSLGIGFLNNPIIAFLFILVAFISIYKATNGKFIKGISVFLWVSFIGFVISILLEEHAEIFEYGMFLFSSSIILGHFYNMRNCLKS
ncbi:MerC domain-containing protein [Flavivirga aquimarina]|uniref:MerC domain-containing protein n=1 Tax=Flavivirga aquimarina TaxID=2027862 RepID=A0ABT8WAJ4_9FLAO|nr:MerC domain-containing protein [Flavivirga aquimarina]MDO5970087.1 MerC domain-containing protein [Flavivirga aquimarina]